MVIVSQGIEYITARNETRDYIDQKLNQFILVSGLVPVPIPNFIEDFKGDKSNREISFIQWIDRISPIGFILSGGNDIGTSYSRDLTERTCLEYARKKNLPLLGICRGMQMLAIWGGGSLVPVSGHVGTRHILSGNFSHEVNSYHSKSINKCPSDFEITARCPHGSIEAISHKDLPWQGWMWHPEREERFNQLDVRNIRHIFSKN